MEKKPKIIRELPQRFKEVKKEKLEAEIEENLEEREEEAEENFAEFAERARTSPGLEMPMPDTSQPIEQQLENVPSKKTDIEQANYEKSVYNMPEYDYEKRASPIKREMQQIGLIVHPEEIHETRQRARVEEWHEARPRGEAARTHEDRIIETEHLDRKQRNPWEPETSKYRRRK